MEKQQAPKNKFMPQGKSKLVKGTLLLPELANLCMIAVPCSMNVKAEDEVQQLLDKKWKQVRAELKGWSGAFTGFKLGEIHSLQVQSDVAVVHLLCFDKDGKLDEKALESCMKKLCELAKFEKGSVHMAVKSIQDIPRLDELVMTHLLENGVNAYFYEETDTKKTG
jgi:hypothetical protein